LTKTVLIVEDDADLRYAVRELLKFEGYRVVEAPSAEAALIILTGIVADIIITDDVLPGMRGVEFCRLVRLRWPQVPVILTTGMDNAAVRLRTVAARVFEKPFPVSEFLSTIASHLDAA
jgi:DNA-binding response OmpR family regulator